MRLLDAGRVAQGAVREHLEQMSELVQDVSADTVTGDVEPVPAARRSRASLRCWQGCCVTGAARWAWLRTQPSSARRGGGASGLLSGDVGGAPDDRSVRSLDILPA